MNIYEVHSLEVRWTVGDSVEVINPDGLGEWEIRALLERAIDLMSEDETREADVAGD